MAEHSFAGGSGNSRDGACFKLDELTRRRKKQSYTENDFSKSTYVVFDRIFTFILLLIMGTLKWKLNRRIL